MKRINKKGFTIVELVIVIAVIAILAGVLIPTFTGLIRKANVSSDTQLVRNLNTALTTDATLNGKHETMQEALDAVNESGFDLAKIMNTKATDNVILWDSENDIFCYLNDDVVTYIPESTSGTLLETGSYKLWKIYSDKDEMASETYSVYLTGEGWGESIAIDGKGLDLGEVASITSVTYDSTSSNEVTIRTNSEATTLSVNAPNGVVNHYDVVLSVGIDEIKNSSYHEFGRVIGNIEIKKGRLELASSAEVGTVLVSSTNTGDVKVDVVSGAEVGTIAPTNANAKEDINSSTSIPADVKQEEVVDTNVTSLFAGGLGTEKSPYLIANETHFYNINSCSASSNYYKQINDISLSTFNSNNIQGTYDGNEFKLTSTMHRKENYIYLFEGITGHVTFKNMNITMGSSAVVLLRDADWGTSYGADFENIIFTSTENVIEVNLSNFGFVIINALYTPADADNVAVYNFKNVINNVNIINSGTCTGVFIGSGPCFNSKGVINYNECQNNGDIKGTSFVGYLYGNSTYISSIESSSSEINVQNCKNTGILSSVNDNSVVAIAPGYEMLNTDEYKKEIGGSYISTNYLKDKDFTLHQNGTTFSIATEDNAVTYKLVLNINSIYYTQDGSTWTPENTADVNEKNNKSYYVSNGTKYLIDINIDNSEEGAINSFHAYDLNTAKQNGINTNNLVFNSAGYTIIVENGVNYIIFNRGSDFYINSSVSVVVYAYSGNTLVGTK